MGVQGGRSAPDPVPEDARSAAREAVQPPPDEMTEGMAAERVACEQGRVDQEDDAPDPDPETAVAEERAEGVVIQDEDEQAGEVQRVPVQVLDEEETRLPAVFSAADPADGARRRHREERAVVGLAVVIARRPERQGEDQDQDRRGLRQDRRPPCRPPAEPGVLQWSRAGRRRVHEQKRRVERRQIRSGKVVRPLEGGPGGVHREAAQAQDGEERADPPPVGSRRRREADDVAAGARQFAHDRSSSHRQRAGILT